MDIETRPDICANALTLPFQKNVFDRVCMVHVIEHLPYRTLPAVLSGVYRVLQPKGLLIIETPDIEACFQEFLHAEQSGRRELLSFIFGLDIPGMKHEMLLPQRLLEIELETAGFEIMGVGPGLSHLSSPGLRIEARKKQSEKADVWSSLWPRIVNSGMIDLINQLEMLEIRESITKCLGDPAPDPVSIAGLAALHPILIIWFMDALTDNIAGNAMSIEKAAGEMLKPAWAKQMMDTYLRALNRRKVDYDIFVRESISPMFISENGRDNEKKKGIVSGIETQVYLKKGLSDLKLFSRYRVQRMLRGMLVQGNRLMLQGRVKEALSLFKQASKGGLWLYADLNIACALGVLGMEKKGIAKYRSILEDLDGKEYRLLRKEINRRIRLLKQGKHGQRPFNYGDFVWRDADVCLARTA